MWLQVYQALCPAVGGRPTASVAEAAARMARAKVGKSYGSPREALLLSAKFVTARLLAAADGAALFSPFIGSLAAEVKCWHAMPHQLHSAQKMLTGWLMDVAGVEACLYASSCCCHAMLGVPL